MVLRTWTLKKTIYDYSNETCWDGPDLGEDESVQTVEIESRLRESLEHVFITARETQTLDTWTLLPVAHLLKALGWDADSQQFHREKLDGLDS
jgi:hypothetical protein